jgi:hypothetical protein
LTDHKNNVGQALILGVVTAFFMNLNTSKAADISEVLAAKKAQIAQQRAIEAKRRAAVAALQQGGAPATEKKAKTETKESPVQIARAKKIDEKAKREEVRTAAKAEARGTSTTVSHHGIPISPGEVQAEVDKAVNTAKASITAGTAVGTAAQDAATAVAHNLRTDATTHHKVISVTALREAQQDTAIAVFATPAGCTAAYQALLNLEDITRDHLLAHGHFQSHLPSVPVPEAPGYFSIDYPVAAAGTAGITAPQVDAFKTAFDGLLRGCTPQADATLSGRGSKISAVCHVQCTGRNI